MNTQKCEDVKCQGINPPVRRYKRPGQWGAVYVLCNDCYDSMIESCGWEGCPPWAALPTLEGKPVAQNAPPRSLTEAQCVGEGCGKPIPPTLTSDLCPECRAKDVESARKSSNEAITAWSKAKREAEGDVFGTLPAKSHLIRVTGEEEREYLLQALRQARFALPCRGLPWQTPTT